MKSDLTEGKFLLYSTLAIVLLMAIHIFQQEISVIYDPKNSIGFHTMLESFSISISATIFFYGFKSFRVTGSNHMLLLSFTFFLVGTLDLLHTLTYKGMPYFISESSVAKATWFWVTARVIQSVMILLLLVIPDRKVKRDYRAAILLLGSVIALAISSGIFHFESKLPLLVVEGQGTTLLKNSFEYFVSFVQFISLIVALYQYYLKKCVAKLSIALALVLLLLTDLIFTIYQSVFDFDNFSGHLFKAVGFYFILRGFYFIKLPEEVEQKEVELQPEIRKTVNFF